jgi:SAM-dependent methyltransferase
MNQPTQSDTANQLSPLYDQTFFDSLSAGSRYSAQQVVPMLLEWLQPKSVVDVGCGLGAWLSVFWELGVQDCLGVDGDYVDDRHLHIPTDAFLARDLAQPLKLDRRFDLAISLEVAEHLPAESANTLIESLVGLADVVLFSAAVPFQGGTGHVNEQWASYWVALFKQWDYVAIDCLRHRLWRNEAIEPWYIQNSLLFVKSNRLEHYPHLPKAALDTADFLTSVPLEVVHPRIYQNSLGYYTEPLKSQIMQLQAELEIAQKAALAAQAEIAAMQTSKFWRLRTHWFRLKQWLAKTGVTS